jgi:biopolymer transport protein ExbD
MPRVWLVLFAFLIASIASAKTYTIRLSQDSQAGAVQVKAGEYKLKVEGSKVFFLDEKNQAAAETEAKVETNGTKYKDTAVAMKNVDGTNRILSITLGGSTTRLVFN